MFVCFSFVYLFLPGAISQNTKDRRIFFFTVFQDHRAQTKFSIGIGSERECRKVVGVRAPRTDESIWRDGQSIVMGNPGTDGVERSRQAGLKNICGRNMCLWQ